MPHVRLFWLALCLAISRKESVRLVLLIFDHVCPVNFREEIAEYVCIQFAGITDYSFEWFILGPGVSDVCARNAVITAYSWEYFLACHLALM